MRDLAIIIAWSHRVAKSSALLGGAPPQPGLAGPWGRPDAFFSIGGLAPKMVPMGSVSDAYSPMQLPNSAEETPEKCRADVKSSPLWGSAPPSCPAQLGCGRYHKILSPFGKCPTAAQPSWALGPAGRIFSIGVLAPQMVPMGSVSDTYSPMQLSKSTEQTPKKSRNARNPHPFWTRPPSPPTLWVLGSGIRTRANPWRLYIIYVQTGGTRTQPFGTSNRAKKWVQHV